jgi:hypothetical protein
MKCWSRRIHLANRERKHPKQASLRRAVSTAYYSVFHLLIDEAVSNWSIVHQQSILARTFDHGKMKSICEDHIKSFHISGSPPSQLQLKEVARRFVRLQEERHIADYDNAVNWSRLDAIEVLDLVRATFSDWRAVRTHTASQDFLLRVFLPKLPRT